MQNNQNLIIEFNGVSIECTPLLFDQIRTRFNLSLAEGVTIDHIKRFISTELLSAIKNEEE